MTNKLLVTLCLVLKGRFYYTVIYTPLSNKIFVSRKQIFTNCCTKLADFEIFHHFSRFGLYNALIRRNKFNAKYHVSHYRLFLFRLTFYLWAKIKSRAKLLIAQKASVEKGIFGCETRGMLLLTQFGSRNFNLALIQFLPQKRYESLRRCALSIILYFPNSSKSFSSGYSVLIFRFLEFLFISNLSLQWFVALSIHYQFRFFV